MRKIILPILLASAALFAAESVVKSSGSPNAPVTLEVFSDFQCPHCARLHFGALKEALSDCVSSGKVRIIYRDYPLQQHPYARKAAEYAGAAARIGRYDRICDALFRTQEAWGASGDIEGAVGKELNATELAKLHKLLADPKSLAEIDRDIDADMAIASKIPLTETPMIMVRGGGKTYPIKGDVRYDRLKALIDSLPVK